MKLPELLYQLQLRGFEDRIVVPIGGKVSPEYGEATMFITRTQLYATLMNAYALGREDGRSETSPEHSPSNVLGAKRYAKLRDWKASSNSDDFGQLIVVKWPGARIELKQGEDLDRVLDLA